MSRETTIQVRVSRAEKAKIKAQADHLGVPTSDFVRSCALREHLEGPGAGGPEEQSKTEVRKETWIAEQVRDLRKRMPLRNAEGLAEDMWRREHEQS